MTSDPYWNDLSEGDYPPVFNLRFTIEENQKKAEINLMTFE